MKALEERLRAWRQAFDARFAESPEKEAEPSTLLLEFREGFRAFAMPVDEVSRVDRAGRLQAPPRSVSGLLGVMALRGRLVPIWDLVAVLGQGAPSPRNRRPWVVVLKGEPALGLAVHAVEGVRKVTRHASRRPEGEPDTGMVQADGRTVLQADRLRAAVESRLQEG